MSMTCSKMYHVTICLCFREVYHELFKEVVGGPWKQIGMLTSVQYMKAFPDYLRSKKMNVFALEVPESVEVYFNPSYVSASQLNKSRERCLTRPESTES